MANSQVLNTPEWLAAQTAWLALLELAERPREDLPWDLLRLYLDRHLNQLQRLTLSGLLGLEQQQRLEALVQARFEQALTELNRQRQQRQPYLVEEQIRRGPFSHYQALGDLERQLKTAQQTLKLPQLAHSIRSLVLHHLNLTLLENCARRWPQPERAEHWQQALPSVLWLSWSEQSPAQALDAILQALPTEPEAIQQLALRVLKSSRFEQAQCSAIRLLDREAAQETLLTLLDYPETPVAVSQEILQRAPVPLPLAWQTAMLHFLARPVPEPEAAEPLPQRQETPAWGRARQLVLRKLAQLDLATSPDLPQAVLQCLQSARHWQPQTRLQAIQTLARFQLITGFEQVLAILQNAARQDDQALLQQAVETFVSLRDPQAVPYLLAVLNGKYRQESALERYRRAFLAENQAQSDFLQAALEQLGTPVYWDLGSSTWKPRA